MKKIFNTIVVYLVLALGMGVFFREFTKFNEFTGYTYLSIIHTHLLILGFLVFLIVLILAKINPNFTEDKMFNKFYVVYNISLGLFASLLLTRGIFQVLGTNYSSGINALISGIAGLTHIMLTVGLVMFVILIKRTFVNNK